MGATSWVFDGEGEIGRPRGGRRRTKGSIPGSEPPTHFGALRVTTTVNVSGRRGSVRTATCLVEKCRARPSSVVGRTGHGVRVDPPRTADLAFPAGIPGKNLPPRAAPQSLWRHGNGRSGLHLLARGGVASAPKFHDALSKTSLAKRCRSEPGNFGSPQPAREFTTTTRSNWPGSGSLPVDPSVASRSLESTSRRRHKDELMNKLRGTISLQRRLSSVPCMHAPFGLLGPGPWSSSRISSTT